jgi:hypothetical protein
MNRSLVRLPKNLILSVSCASQVVMLPSLPDAHLLLWQLIIKAASWDRCASRIQADAACG